MDAKRYRTYCAYCGGHFTWSGRGRHPLFCSPKCRTASHRAGAANECVSPALCGAGGGHELYCVARRERLHGLEVYS